MNSVKTRVISQAGKFVDATFVYQGENSTRSEDESAREAFDFALERILGRKSWSSFTKKTILRDFTNLTEDQDFQFNKRFFLPSDFFKPLMILPGTDYGSITPASIPRFFAYGRGDKLPEFQDYEIRGNAIYANLSPLAVVYTSNDIENVNNLPGNFTTALVFCTAYFLSVGIYANPKLAAFYNQEFEREVKHAGASDRLSYMDSSERVQRGVRGGVI